jgi:starch phosphorylase
VTLMRESMADLTPRFSATRMVPEYTERYYLPAAIAYTNRAANQGARGAEIVNWRCTLQEKWKGLRFGELKVETAGGRHRFEIPVWLNELDPTNVKIELYADAVNGEGPVRQEMTPDRQRGSVSSRVYHTEVPATRPVTDYTPRVIPYHPAVAIPLEASSILWQR